MRGPDPTAAHPIPAFPRVCFIKNTVQSPNIIVGEYSYYDDPEDPEGFERRVLHHYPEMGDKLIIGRFCAVASRVTFIMNGANHKMSGFSTYPFQIFGHGWERVMPRPDELPFKGDTVVGNDVWIGHEAVIMPGVHIGDGAIVAAKSVVVGDVAPYTIVGGNPARPIRARFPDAVVAELLAIAWWNWDIEKISRNLEAIVGADLDALRRCV
jgi:virginiamycin A acetyltransferase